MSCIALCPGWDTKAARETVQYLSFTFGEHPEDCWPTGDVLQRRRRSGQIWVGLQFGDLYRDVGVLVGVVRRADPVVAVGDLRGNASGQVAADHQTW